MKERMKQHTSIKIVTVFALLLFLVPSIEAVEVDIPDPGLEAAIREELEKPTGPITDTDLETLTSLNASGRGIEESTGGLTGLEYCVNLEVLHLESNNNISDLDPLSGLTNLWFLNLSTNNISDLDPLSELFKLKVLWLSSNKISNISPLEELFNLVDLDLTLNNITNIGSLSELTGLQTLNLGCNDISDITQLSQLISLQSLCLGSTKVSDISTLQYLTGLEELDLSFNDISNINPLQYLTGLQRLWLDENNISDISLSLLQYLTNLYELSLCDIGISDIGALKNLNNLKVLWLCGNNISDISPLSALSLISLELDDNNISNISALSGLTNLAHLNLRDNNISNIQALVNNLGLGGGDDVDLLSNPLGCKAITIDIPTLQSRGVTVKFDDRTPTTLLKISGDEQSGWPNLTLQKPFVVQVLDEGGCKFAGETVTFTVTGGGGSVDVWSTKTDLNGFAESTLTLGPSPGVNTVIVAAAEISTYETFTAMASYPVMADVLYFMNNAVVDERLFGSGLGQSADRKINAIYEKLEEAERLIEEGLIGEAYGQLKEVYTRTDGQSRPPDFVAGPAAPQLAELIQYFADYLIEQVEDKPDLVVSEIILHSDEISPGDILEYTYTVANIGGEGPDGDSIFDVATYLSTDEYFDADTDTELDWGYSVWEYHLDAGWSDSYTENDVAIEAAPGTYYLIVVADAKPGEPPNYYPGVVESNEDNNWRAIQFTVSEPIPEG